MIINDGLGRFGVVEVQLRNFSFFSAGFWAPTPSLSSHVHTYTYL